MAIQISNTCDGCGIVAKVSPGEREDVGWLKVVRNWNLTEGPEQVESDVCSFDCLARWVIAQVS